MGYFKSRIIERYDAVSDPVSVYWFRYYELMEITIRMQKTGFRGGRRVRAEELSYTDPRYISHRDDLITALELERRHLLRNGYVEDDLEWIERVAMHCLCKEKEQYDHYIPPRLATNNLITPSLMKGAMRSAIKKTA